jgi:hypothetical protein
MKTIFKIWIGIGIAGGVALIVLSQASFSEILAATASFIIFCFVLRTAWLALRWLLRKWVEHSIDRHRYHISDPDKDCGCYRLDRKTGSVQYIEPKTGAMSAKQEQEIAEDQEKI